MKNRLKTTDDKHKQLDKHSSRIILLLKIFKLDSSSQPQLLFATQPYCTRTRQGQHYRHDVACLEQEFITSPPQGAVSNPEVTLVAVKTIFAYTNVVIFLFVTHITFFTDWHGAMRRS